MTFLHNLLGEVHIPERVLSLVPRQSENIVKESDFTGSLHIIFVLKTVNFLLKHLACGLWHGDDFIKFLLILALVTLFVVFEYALVGVLQQTCLRSFLKFLRSLLNVVELLVYDLMHFFIQVNHFTTTMQGVPRLNKRVDHGAHTLVFLAEDGLEDGEVKVSHLENDLIEYFEIFRALWVLVDVK